MALDFPNSPTVGQIFPASNGTDYRWDGVAWRTVAGGAGAPVSWNSVTSKPSSFPPAPHQHPPSDVQGLVDLLAAKLGSADPVQLTALRTTPGLFAGYYLRSKGDGTIELVPPATVASPYATGPTPPSDPVAKPFWFDSNSGQLMVWYDDGNSAQWVSSSPSGNVEPAPTPTPTPTPPTTGAVADRNVEAVLGRDGTTVESR